MAKLHFVQRAAKTYRGTGIKKGSPYYWFKHRRGKKVRSKNLPPRSAYLTGSPYLQAMLDIEDRLKALQIAASNGSSVTEFIMDLESISASILNWGEECQITADRIRNTFPNGCPTIELLEERSQLCHDMSGRIDELIDSIEADEDDKPIRSSVERAVDSIISDFTLTQEIA